MGAAAASVRIRGATETPEDTPRWCLGEPLDTENRRVWGERDPGRLTQRRALISGLEIRVRVPRSRGPYVMLRDRSTEPSASRQSLVLMQSLVSMLLLVDQPTARRD